MKDIKDIKATQIRIFPVDEIGFQSLQRQTATNRIKGKYSFKDFFISPMPELQPIEIQKVIMFKNGEFNYKNKFYLIDQLVIESRRIIITLSSSSDIADIFYEDLKNMLIELDLREKKPEYRVLLKSNETTCILKLDFYLHELFKKKFINNFQEMMTDKIESQGCKLEIVPHVVRFKISYLNEPATFKKNKITFVDKEFIIEMRERSQYEDKLYFTSSPTDTKKHLELLSEIEKLVTKK